jgi:hypothetical protein
MWKTFLATFPFIYELNSVRSTETEAKEKLVTEMNGRKRAKHKCNLRLIKLSEINFCSRIRNFLLPSPAGLEQLCNATVFSQILSLGTLFK